jgi:dephospho-CoA kinase
MKIGICGRMASGKTTLANELEKQFLRQRKVALEENVCQMSLAGKVKEIARDLFFMQGKDRPLLQKIGMKMREIEENVWLDYVLESANRQLGIVIVDDVRFINEAVTMKENEWIMIKIVVDEETQLERLKKTYPHDWERHWENRNNPSESQVDHILDEVFDFIIDANDVMDFEADWIVDYNQMRE